MSENIIKRPKEVLSRLIPIYEVQELNGFIYINELSRNGLVLVKIQEKNNRNFCNEFSKIKSDFIIQYEELKEESKNFIYLAKSAKIRTIL